MKKTDLINFFDNQMVVILTTMDNNMPQTRAVVNLRNKNIAPYLTEYFKNDDRMLFITNTHSNKIKQIRKNQVANIYTFDNNFSGLMLGGKIREITDKTTMDALWDDSWKMYYPSGRDGGDFSVLEFIPETFHSYNGNGFTKTNGAVK